MEKREVDMEELIVKLNALNSGYLFESAGVDGIFYALKAGSGAMLRLLPEEPQRVVVLGGALFREVTDFLRNNGVKVIS